MSQPNNIRRVVIASFIGTTIEWYDFFLYGTATGVVGMLRLSETGALARLWSFASPQECASAGSGGGLRGQRCRALRCTECQQRQAGVDRLHRVLERRKLWVRAGEGGAALPHAAAARSEGAGAGR
jgi:hypothetical protein